MSAAKVKDDYPCLAIKRRPGTPTVREIVTATREAAMPFVAFFEQVVRTRLGGVLDSEIVELGQDIYMDGHEVWQHTLTVVMHYGARNRGPVAIVDLLARKIKWCHDYRGLLALEHMVSDPTAVKQTLEQTLEELLAFVPSHVAWRNSKEGQ